MDGFIVDDDEIGEAMQDDGVGDVGDGNVEIVEDEDTEDVVAPKSPLKLRRSQRHIVREDETDTDKDKDEVMHLDDTDKAQTKPIADPDNNAITPADQVDIVPQRADSPLREATALPTPPQEVDDDVPPSTILKRASAIESRDAADLSGYDSDIFMSFGDREINEFCSCSKASAAVAKFYLLRADGKTERAITMYFDDFENVRPTQRAESSTSAAKGKPPKNKGKGKPVLLPDANEFEDDQQDLATISGPSFKDVLPKQKELAFLTDLVSKLRPGDLQATLNDIASIAMSQKLDRSKSF